MQIIDQMTVPGTDYIGLKSHVGVVRYQKGNLAFQAAYGTARNARDILSYHDF